MLQKVDPSSLSSFTAALNVTHTHNNHENNGHDPTSIVTISQKVNLTKNQQEVLNYCGRY